ncbi:MAG: tryptophan--tRNA ligase [Chitinivibrionales bacterium]|nr:tryptophan--tRNA ligase [Chitinivibrionales bacterium]
MRVLSGIQPSGKVHIGNYLGMIKQMVTYQQTSDLYCFLANMHSLTSVFEGNVVQSNTFDLLVDLIALGIDPEKSTLWVQSDVPEVTELTWYLNNATPVALLERCTSYKDKIAHNLPANNGLFSYPVLQAADILLYRTDRVPVGKDQKQHVEITRDIAVKFNTLYGDILTIPEHEIREDVAVVPGIDGQKMSKSYNNSIEIFADEKELKKRVMSIVTDSRGVDEKKEPESNTIYQYYKLFASPQDTEVMAQKLRGGGYGYGEAKKALLGLLLDYFSKQRTLRSALAVDKSYIAEVRKKGAQKARNVATEVLDAVRTAVGVR